MNDLRRQACSCCRSWWIARRDASGPEQGESAASCVTMNIEIPGRALVSLEGAVNAEIVRAVLESLRG
jgi:hypothetical protein